MRIAYLGPPGTFSEEAVARCDLVAGDAPAPYPTFADAYHALKAGEVEGALLPIENSIEGSVGATLDLLEPAHSTADAARRVAAGEPDAAAIGSRAAAERFGLAIVAESIQDVDENVTRFVLLAQADEAPTGRDRTSIAFTLDRDRPGGLYEVLGEFARWRINLSKVESRPMKEALGHYVFFLDFERHRSDPEAAAALAGVRARVDRLFLLGSYPQAGGA